MLNQINYFIKVTYLYAYNFLQGNCVVLGELFCTIAFQKYSIMNKSELIDQIAKDSGITKTQANGALDAFMGAVVATLKKGDTVTLVGFGTFSVSNRAARNGRNPQTGATIKIKARKVPKFKAGKDFTSKIAGGKAKK